MTSPRPDDPFHWVGHIIDAKYRIDDVVGEGGFAVVYRAHHLGFDAPVAVKCLKVPAALSSHDREAFLATFANEGRLLHKLSRSCAAIVQALDAGAAVSPLGTWTPYLVLEWLEGVTLHRELRNREARGKVGRPLPDAMALLEPAARALAIAHVQGVAHRDIKPANLFFAEVDGRRTLKVLDFGIARVLTESVVARRTLETQGQSLFGFTPRYAAPEQFAASYGPTGPWTDVFAFALVLVEVASGRMALDGEQLPQMYLQACNLTTRPTLRTLGVPTSDAVEAVLARALAVDPRRRHASLGAMWNELSDATPESARARPSERPAPVWLKTDRTIGIAPRVELGASGSFELGPPRRRVAQVATAVAIATGAAFSTFSLLTATGRRSPDASALPVRTFGAVVPGATVNAAIELSFRTPEEPDGGLVDAAASGACTVAKTPSRRAALRPQR